MFIFYACYQNMFLKQNYWQDGYAIFSVNPAQLNVVSTYIKAQAEHHIKRSFKDELRMFFMKYNIDFDERYVWE